MSPSNPGSSSSSSSATQTPNPYTGDFEIINLQVTTVDQQKYNVRFMMAELNIYEDIWNNQTTCDLLLDDAKNNIQNFPIFGFETLLVQFRTPTKKIFSKTFRLVNITDRKLLKEREAGYLLHWVSMEAITNMKIRVSKSYKGKLISDIVTDLHNNFLEGGPIEVEPTQYQHHIIIPKIFPCQAINWLATRANSAAYTGANYLYYEDNAQSGNQFHFVTMESRLSQKSAQTYKFQVADIRKDQPGYKPETLHTNHVSIQVYNFTHFSDILENVQAGMYGNELITHSNSRKIWRDYTFDYPSTFDNYTHLYKTNLLFNPIFQDNVPDSKLKLFTTGHDQDQYPFLAEKWIPPRVSQLQQLENIKVTIQVPGDSERTVGQIIELNLPSPEPPINNIQVDDKYYSGRYLIQSLRHKIDMEKYLTIMELVKDSTAVAYPA